MPESRPVCLNSSGSLPMLTVDAPGLIARERQTHGHRLSASICHLAAEDRGSISQSGSFAGAIALGRLAPCGKDGSPGANELSAPLPDLSGGAGTATGLSPPLGATFTPFSSRGIGGGLVAAGVEPFGAATRCPFITARTSLIARVCSRGDLSMST